MVFMIYIILRYKILSSDNFKIITMSCIYSYAIYFIEK